MTVWLTEGEGESRDAVQEREGVERVGDGEALRVEGDTEGDHREAVRDPLKLWVRRLLGLQLPLGVQVPVKDVLRDDVAVGAAVLERVCVYVGVWEGVRKREVLPENEDENESEWTTEAVAVGVRVSESLRTCDAEAVRVLVQDTVVEGGCDLVPGEGVREGEREYVLKVREADFGDWVGVLEWLRVWSLESVEVCVPERVVVSVGRKELV